MPVGVRHHLNTTTSLATRIVDDYLATRPQGRDNAEAQIACLRGVARIVRDMNPPDLTEQAGRLPYLLGLTEESVTHELTEAAAPTTPLPGTGIEGLRAFRKAGTHRYLQAPRGHASACVIAPTMTLQEVAVGLELATSPIPW